MTLMMLLDGLLTWLSISHSDCDPELRSLAVIVIGWATGDPFLIFKFSILGGDIEISVGGIVGSSGSRRDPEDDDPEIRVELVELY